MKIFVKEQLSPHKYKTPEGYLICTDAILARTGKQAYKKGDFFPDAADADTDYEVDRLAKDVFDEKAISSFENMPITVEHPEENVTSENWKTHSVGFVRDVHQGEFEGQPVLLGNLVIQDEQTIKEIEAGEHTELSCGYNCDIDDEENPHQTNIRGNHVALCQAGRAGIARIQDSKPTHNEVKSLEADIRAILSKYNEEKSSKITLFEVKPGTFVEHYDDGDIDFSKLEKHNEGKLRYSFSITGGLNGNGEWTDYLEDLKKKFEELESKTGLKVVIQDITNDVADDVWTAKVFMYETTHNSIKDVEPNEGEDKQSFISRFMRATKEEYPDRKQRLAVAYSYWDKAKDSCKDATIIPYLVDKQGRRINKGDEVIDFRGDKAKVTGWQAPTHAGSTGRVYVVEPGSSERGYFPSVYNLEWKYEKKDAVNDKLVDEPKAWAKMKSLMKSQGHKLDKEGKTWTGRHHLEFDSEKTFEESTWRAEAGKIADLVEKVEKEFGTPATYNIAFNPRNNLIHSVIDIDEKFIPDSLTKDKVVEDAKYEIKISDPRLRNLKLYEKDYNIKCEKEGTYTEWGERVTYWYVTGQKQDIIDFITDYNLDRVSRKVSDSLKDSLDVQKVVKISKIVKLAKK